MPRHQVRTWQVIVMLSRQFNRVLYFFAPAAKIHETSDAFASV
jgi:hypothetical protein